MTGPSYPMRGTEALPNGDSISYKLPRSDEGRGTLHIAIQAPEGATSAILEWRRYPTDEPYESQAMTANVDGQLETRIPPQPAAGKVEYRILLETAGGVISIPSTETVVARYRGDVPAPVLIPHILAMFLSMLVSSRALFEVLRPQHVGVVEGALRGPPARRAQGPKPGARIDGAAGDRGADSRADRPAFRVRGILDRLAVRP